MDPPHDEASSPTTSREYRHRHFRVDSAVRRSWHGLGMGLGPGAGHRQTNSDEGLGSSSNQETIKSSAAGDDKRRATDDGFSSRGPQSRSEDGEDGFDSGGFTRDAILYLGTVYSCVAVSVVGAAVGLLSTLSSASTDHAGPIAGLVLLMLIYLIPPTSKLLLVRVALLALFACMEGRGMPESFSTDLENDPSAYSAALAAAFVVFGAATLAALTFAPQSASTDGETTSSIPAALLIRVLSYITFLVLSATLVETNYGFLGDWVFSASPYISLVISGSFVAVDTQLLASRASSGASQPKDPVKDAIMIFLDSVDVFRKVTTVYKHRSQFRKECAESGASWG